MTSPLAPPSPAAALQRSRTALHAAWQAAARRFEARAPRERLLLSLAAAALLLGLGDSLWLEPAWQRWAQLRQQRAEIENAVAALQDQARQHEALRTSRAQAEQQELADLQRRQAQRARDPAAARVGPDEMLALLAHLLERQPGLRVRALRSLGSTALGPTASGSPATPAAGSGPALYRHAVELQVEGGYAELLAYLQALEALPQPLLWGPLQLEVLQHPQLRLSLRLYTLSPHAGWVAL